MHIKAIVLDGFKSYGNRVEVTGFDPEFNAITGLNGTGKSNILDSICFVLGITNLSNVRAGSLQELIYKHGQAGITKATVSITFDNRDKGQCPIGYENHDEITVTRQVVMGGKNKYLINGINVQNKRVSDLFCSVQLNVNNPHFLIMQGRITKVLNMKPPEEWRDMRSTLSPAFTSSKIKLMVPFMEEVGEQMILALNKKIKESLTCSIDIDCKDLSIRYASDVIASCAFGLKVDSITHENNKFFLLGKQASGFQLRQMLIFFIMSACPIVANKLKLTLFSSEVKNFFTDLVLNTMKDRESRNIIRPDMIHLLMEAKKGQLSHEDKNCSEIGNTGRDAGFATVEESKVGQKKIDRVWSDIDLVAQATLFLIAGFETVSTGMAFALHELALNPDVQERLYLEIKENEIQNGGKLNYTAIQNMTYMDMVVSEVLRMWPPGVALDRICDKDYNMGKPNSKSAQDYIIRKGEAIWIPTWSFHRDPKYFPNPERFDLERFSDENKHLINLTAYMPFGLGSRNCIGSRFALCEIKVFLYQILMHFELSPSSKLQLPSKLSVESFNPRLVGGHWLTFKLRN